jgi:hypothetical protein
MAIEYGEIERPGITGSIVSLRVALTNPCQNLTVLK